ncbi:MAG: class I SAM-dependent methyltransferase [Propionibacteriaceae bacterium]|uniref:Methyltransferase domain n=1 Tax=Propionibacterium ruminifibrarum TaxID=1962131 RepID=A0A375HYH2_9ACTN|nr:class I SAM-dependent methyltransferase [Propionibacterium ruminifibrarum]MBE6478210.1 class I SAM-dependent methyltransferase [Propionibacteriaceae bacterium]SPF67551.1 Methyltransferase domain [Propionibacterium ruminifibrarum]
MIPRTAGNPAVAVFDERAEDYDQWFDEHPNLHRAELTAVGELLAQVRAVHGADARCLEIGVGTGRFAAPLGIGHGVEPAPRMARVARARGVDTVIAVAEALPYRSGAFACTLFVTSLCFVADPLRALREARRVTYDDGAVIVAFLDLASDAGLALAATPQRAGSYYAAAHLRTGAEITELLRGTGFRPSDSRQVRTDLGDEAPVVRPGTGDGLFCCLLAHADGAAAG